MFAAGMHYWQLGDSPYWGHNAILRIEPFRKHCALPRLSGKPPFGGDILSHDFVEAALLGRAGWSIWLAFDLPGSYEETPGSLLEEMQRDKRWCQGNLQHLRLLFTEGLSSVHRALFLNGIFSYVSAALWLGFLVASTGEAVMWPSSGRTIARRANAVSDLAGLEAERARRAVSVVVGCSFFRSSWRSASRCAGANAPIMVAQRRCCAASFSRAFRRRCSHPSTWPSTAASCS
jgi:membrane glycosyltransferase